MSDAQSQSQSLQGTSPQTPDTPRSPSPSSSDTPDAGKAIYTGGTYGKGGGNKKYFDPVDIVPGQSEPFRLPPGADHCPIASCPRYRRKCTPHWRLNEHMKLRHGWPRKNTQPNTDKRLARVSQSTRRFQRRRGRPRGAKSAGLVRESERGEYSRGQNSAGVAGGIPGGESSQLSEIGSHDHENESDENHNIDGDTHTADMARPKRTVKLTEKRRIQMDAFKPKQYPPSTSDRNSTPRRTRLATGALSRHAVEEDDTLVADFDDVETLLSESTNDSDLKSADNKVDGDMVVRISQLITSLLADKSSSRAANLKLAKSYQKLLDDDKIRFNCAMPAEQGNKLMSIYRTLSERDSAQQQIMEPVQMVPAPEPMVGGVPHGWQQQRTRQHQNHQNHQQYQNRETTPQKPMHFLNTYQSSPNSQYCTEDQLMRHILWQNPYSPYSPETQASHAAHSIRGSSNTAPTAAGPPDKKRKFSGTTKINLSARPAESKDPSGPNYMHKKPRLQSQAQPELYSQAAKTHHRNQIVMPRPASLLQQNSGFTTAQHSPLLNGNAKGNGFGSVNGEHGSADSSPISSVPSSVVSDSGKRVVEQVVKEKPRYKITLKMGKKN